MTPYDQANHYINEGLIRTRPAPEPSTEPRTRRQWMEWFLPRLDNPQLAFEAIHVAGTSGKGSVCTMLAHILHAAGIHTGLHVSPYLQVATEKLWVDALYATEQQYLDLVEWVRPAAEACRGPHVPLHGMASVAIALEHNRRAGVEIGVMEAGVGGRMDLTNVMRTRLAVITNVGLDHLKTLGPTLKDIAWHKAGIIKRGCRALVMEGPGAEAARRQAERVGAPLRILRRASFSGAPQDDGAAALTFAGKRLRLDRALVAMRGAFQVDNAAMAVAAVEELDPGGQRISADAIRTGLARARIPGRLELIPAGALSPCPVLIDGAHNPDKLSAMLGSVTELSFDRLHVVYGSLGHRAPDRELRQLASAASTFVATSPRVYQKTARPPGEIIDVISGCSGSPLVREPPGDALDTCISRAAPGDMILVTGSLYLCGEIRQRWYPDRQVIERRTSWF